MKTKAQTINELLACGQRLSNICYFFGQHEGMTITKNDVKVLKQYTQQWDSLMTTLNLLSEDNNNETIHCEDKGD